jgi:hypothetical protein
MQAVGRYLLAASNAGPMTPWKKATVGQIRALQAAEELSE